MARRGFPMPEVRVEPAVDDPASDTAGDTDMDTRSSLPATGAGAGAGSDGFGASAGAGGGKSSITDGGDSGAGLPGPARPPDLPGTTADESKAGDCLTGATWRQFKPGQRVDVLDSVGKWCDAVVAEVDEDSVFVHYVYWSSKWDERIPRASARLAKHRTHIYFPGGELKLGQRVDVFDRHEARRKWCKGEIVDALEDRVLVHFHGWTSRWDEWHPRDSEFLAPCGEHTSTFRPYRPKASHFWRNRKRDRLIAETAEGWPRYCIALGEMGFRIKGCEGDGNCLFRAVSHQLYGTTEHHALVRAAALDYMEIHRKFFQPFVAYSNAAFDAYLSYKRRLGVWGDDPEIQAMCEMYNRPAHLFVYHPKKGASRMRTFHDNLAGASRPPMRLSYYGGGHYDSIVRKDGITNHLSSRPGEAESAILALAKSQVAAAAEEAAKRTTSDGKVDGDSTLDAVTRESRDQFDLNDVNVEEALMQQLAATSDADATQSLIMRQVQDMSRRRDLADLEQKQLEEAKQRSAADAGITAPDTTAEDREIFRAMAASEAIAAKKAEDDALREAIAASRRGQDVKSADEAMLQAILAESRAEAGVALDRDLMLGMATADDDYNAAAVATVAALPSGRTGSGAAAGDTDEPMDRDTLLALQLSLMMDD